MNQHYQALAIKYRPKTINELKGQEVLVTTLQNAFSLNRISHAFMLTGVRGVGKTTTARIIAKALNCVGVDGTGDITLNPCGVCPQCVSINEDKNLDVLEMDAASKTGIDDIREVIENVKYKPISARYKVFIIDEVHMLSKSAFNALLKTLEEPPQYVKFIFATTEIKKVPITVISRCQRFDLRRLDVAELSAHLANLCSQENVTFEKNALDLIAKAGDGSVRDSLSILDQAISHTNANLTEAAITEMLGLNNKGDLYDLFENLVKSNTDTAINIINKQYQKGTEIISIFEELLEICHFVTMIKTAPKVLEELTLTESEKTRGSLLAENLTLSNLITLWQLLLKGIDELKLSVFPKKTADMLVVRITWVNDIATLPALKRVLNAEGHDNINIEAVEKKNILVNNNLVEEQTSNSTYSTKQPTQLNNTNISQQVVTPTNDAEKITTQSIEKENIKPDNSVSLLNTATTHNNTDNMVVDDEVGTALLEEIKDIFPKAELVTKKP